MADHFAELHRDGEPLAALWASESSIYGRFGYGPASELARVKLDKDLPRWPSQFDRRDHALVDREEALAVFLRFMTKL